MIPSAVPKVAMLIVSHMGCQSWLAYSQRGGTIRLIKSLPWRPASSTNTHMVLSEITFQQSKNRLMPASQATYCSHWARLVRRCHCGTP